MQPLRLRDGRLRRGGVRGDGIVPQPQPREDVRRHVQRMRRIRRDRGVRARRLEAQLGQGRVVHAVNDVVRHAGMVPMAWQQLVENLAALLLPRIRLVGRVEVTDRHQLQSVENRSLVVVGVAITDRGQSLFVVLRAGGVIDRLPVLVEHREGIDVVALAVRSSR